MKAAFGPSFKEVLCEKQLVEGKINPGSPSVLVISSSALRSLELYRFVATKLQISVSYFQVIGYRQQVQFLALLSNYQNLCGLVITLQGIAASYQRMPCCEVVLKAYEDRGAGRLLLSFLDHFLGVEFH